MVYVSTKIQVLNKSGEFEIKDSIKLIPGDVIIVPNNGYIIPCDCVLISGNCIVNESMLTGECFPTTKTPLQLNDLDNSNKIYSTSNYKNNTLYCGTTVSQLHHYEHSHVLAIVINTGFCTYKGTMVHSVIFPKLIKFAFFRDSLKFIILLGLMSLAGVIYCIYIFVKMEGTYSLIFRKSLDMITLLVPPCLPAALAIATIYSMNRLKRHGISCIDTTRINVCGKLKMFCFDKTGTLTEEGITISGVLNTQSIKDINSNTNIFKFNKRVEKDLYNLSDKNMLYCMATCHTLYNIDGKIIGDPIDTVMFDYTKWILHNNDNLNINNNEFGNLNIKTVEPPLYNNLNIENSENNKLVNNTDIAFNQILNSFSLLKTYQFESELQRMTVITKNIDNNQFLVFSKGSPEAIKKLCTLDSIPHDFSEILFLYAEKGYRILGMACKYLDKSQPWHKIMKMKRNEIEKDMKFLGFLLLHNKLKPKSASVINYLTSLNTRMCMVTGDNMLTALSIGCECGIISFNQSIIQVEAKINSKNLCINYITHQYSKFVFQSDSDILISNKSSITKFSNDSFLYKNKNFKNSQHGTSNHYLKQLVIDGESFELIKTYESKENYYKLLVSGVIFARMSPQQKTTLVKDLQSIGYVVAMVGDGANDCGALKAAHAGIALATSDASVVSPFTTRDGCLSCVPTLLSEGRTSLTTAFSMFKFVLMYSFTQFTSVLVLYHCYTVFSNGKFLYIDLFLLGPLISTMLNLEPAKFIYKKRPLGRLAHPQVFFSLGGYYIFQLLLHLIIINVIKKYKWFISIPYTGGEDLDTYSQENTAIFCSLNFLYIFASISVSLGPPHRKFFFSNKNYLFALFVTFLTSFILLIFPGPILQYIISLDDIPSLNFRYTLFMTSIIIGIFVILWEYTLNYSTYVRKFVNIFRFKKNNRNEYKNIVLSIANDSNWPSNSFKPINENNYDDSSFT